jgi:hypothetical protein
MASVLRSACLQYQHHDAELVRLTPLIHSSASEYVGENTQAPLSDLSISVPLFSFIVQQGVGLPGGHSSKDCLLIS